MLKSDYNKIDHGYDIKQHLFIKNKNNVKNKEGGAVWTGNIRFRLGRNGRL